MHVLIHSLIAFVRSLNSSIWPRNSIKSASAGVPKPFRVVDFARTMGETVFPSTPFRIALYVWTLRWSSAAAAAPRWLINCDYFQVPTTKRYLLSASLVGFKTDVQTKWFDLFGSISGGSKV